MTVLWTPYGYVRFPAPALSSPKRPMGFGAKPASAASPAPAKKSGFGFDPKRTKGAAS